MSRYQLSAPARQDLIEIRDFISKDSKIAARKVLAEIRAACLLLAKRPNIGHLRKDLVAEPLRFWPVYSYMIVYAMSPIRLKSSECFTAPAMFRRCSKYPCSGPLRAIVAGLCS